MPNADDVYITPASKKIDFYDSSSIKGKLYFHGSYFRMYSDTVPIGFEGHNGLHYFIKSSANNRLFVYNYADGSGYGTYAANYLQLRDSSSNVEAYLVAGNGSFVSGSLGVGTNSPSGKFTVSGGASTFDNGSGYAVYFKNAGSQYGAIDTYGSSLSIEASNEAILSGASGVLLKGGNYGVLLPPLGTNAGDTSRLRFRELAANGTADVSIKAPDSIASGIQMILPAAAGTANQVLAIDSVSSGIMTLGFQDAGGGGDVTKVGTPANNQVGVWTGDGTIEGDANFTWDASQLALTGTDGNTRSLYLDPAWAVSGDNQYSMISGSAGLALYAGNSHTDVWIDGANSRSFRLRSVASDGSFDAGSFLEMFPSSVGATGDAVANIRASSGDLQLLSVGSNDIILNSHNNLNMFFDEQFTMYSAADGNPRMMIRDDSVAAMEFTDSHFINFKNATSTKMSIDTANGYLGIGTSSPNSLLEVMGTNPKIIVDGGGSDDASIELRESANYGGRMYYDGDNNIFMKFTTIDGGTEKIRMAYDRDGNVYLGSADGSDATPNPNMFIAEGGNVGIGESSPTDKLNINTGAGTFDFKDYNMTYSTSLGIRAEGSGYLGLVTEGGNEVFLSTNGFANKRLRVTSAGDVTLGGEAATVNGARLHVNASDTNLVANFFSTDGIGEIRVGDNYTHATNTHKYTRILNVGHQLKLMPNNGAEMMNLDGSAYKTTLLGETGGNSPKLIFDNPDASNDIQLTQADSGWFGLSSDGGSTQHFVLRTGNVGIGTESPSAKLHLKSSSSNEPTILMENTNADDSAPFFTFNKNSASPADGDELGYIQFKGDDSAGNSDTFADIYVSAEDVTATDEDSSINFRTMANGTLTNTMSVRSGRVGIGTASHPGASLEIRSSLTNMRLSYGSGDYADFQVMPDGELRISTNDADASNANINLNPDGNVGIGTNSPSQKLDVVGAAQIGTLMVTGSTLAVQREMKNDITTDTTLSDSYSSYQAIADGGSVPTVTLTAPASPSVGDEYVIVGTCIHFPGPPSINATVRIVANTGQTINGVNTNIQINTSSSGQTYAIARLICIDTNTWVMEVSSCPVA